MQIELIVRKQMRREKSNLEDLKMSYEYKRAEHPSYPAVSIRKGGAIAFNSFATKKFGQLIGARASLLHDPDRKTLTIRFVDAETGNSFKVMRVPGRNPVIYCQIFLKKCGIPYEMESKYHSLFPGEHENTVVVELK